MPTSPAMQPGTDLIAIVQRRSGLILGCALLGLGLGLLYHVLAPRSYQSTCELLVEYRNPRLPAAGSQSDNEAVLVDYEELLDTHVEIITSERILFDAVQTAELDQLPSIQAEVARLNPGEDTVDYLHAKVSAYPGGGKTTNSAHLITVGFTHPDADDAARVLSAVVEAYQKFLKNELSAGLEEAQQLISTAHQDLEQELRKLEEEYIQFREQTPIFYDQQSLFNRHVKHLSTLEQEQAEVNIALTRTRSRIDLLEKIRDQLATGSIKEFDALALLGDDSVERLALLLEIHQRNSANEVFQAELPTRTEAAKAEAETLLPLQLEEEQLSRLYGNSSQELRSVRERIAAVKLFLNQQRNQLRKLEDSSPQSPLEYSEAYLQILKNDLITLQERSQQLEEIALKEEQRAQSVAAFEVQEQTMKSALERKSELYKILLKNLGDMNLIKDFSTYNTRVMSRIKPGEKIWPKSRFSLPAGLFLGAVVGMGLALTREVRDRRFHSPNEVESTLGLNVIAQLPPASPLLGKLSLLTAPQSPEAEAIRSIRTTLLNRRRHDLHAKTVGIMSMQSDDVTARVAANVALSLAQVSPRVLLIESNFHSPMLQGIFQLPQSRTLNDLMAGQVSLAETIHRVQQGLHVIVANRDEQLANDVFADGRFEKQIQSLRAHYDWILLSTPAAASSNDLHSIGQLFDLGLFMLIADQEDSVRDVQLMRRLRELNIPVDYAVIQQVHDNLFSGR